jgi:hypothetical protein
VWGVDYNADNAFDGIMGEGTVTFAAYDLQSQGTTRLEVLIDRLIGDSMLASGNRTAPTYGFHNHARPTFHRQHERAGGGSVPVGFQVGNDWTWRHGRNAYRYRHVYHSHIEHGGKPVGVESWPVDH